MLSRLTAYCLSLIGIKNEIVFGHSIRCYGCSVKSKHAIGLKHQTQALMGTTPLASGKKAKNNTQAIN